MTSHGRRNQPRALGGTLLLVVLSSGFGSCRETSTRDGPHAASSQASSQSAPGPPPPEAKREASGLVTLVLGSGRAGRHPGEHDTVRVHFTGWNEKGKRFEDTRLGGAPKTLDMAAVIPGFREALLLMTVGERRRAWVPDELGYRGRPGSPRGTTVFDVELVEIVRSVQFLPAPPDVRTPPRDAEHTESGLVYRYLDHGQSSESPEPWDRVTLDFESWTADGKPFDSSRTLGHAATFDVADVVPGWAEVLPKLVVGDRVRLWVPAALAYDGKHGRPRGPVVFDLALRSIERRPEPPRAPAALAAPPKAATTTESGLSYQVLERGKGQRSPSADSRVRVHYSGWTPDGQLFDSSVVRGHPTEVRLNRMMPGWVEGVQKMVEGERTVFWIPEKLAYGGRPVGTPGNLVYEINLLEILP